jgi:type I restriction enzyme S subunit
MAKAKKKETLTPEERLQAALVPDWEQPYKVPENWCWTKLSSLSNLISKGTTPKGGKSSYSNNGVKFLRVENINDDGTISHENIAYVSEETHKTFLKRSILEENDILISIAGTLGKTGIIRNVDLPMNTNQAVAFVRTASDKVNVKYIKNSIDSPVIQDLLLGKTKVTSIPNLTLENYRRVSNPSPTTPRTTAHC